MSDQQQQSSANDKKIDNKLAFGLLYVFANSHRLLITAFTRHSYGLRAHEPYSFFALFIILLLAGTSGVFIVYFWLWLAAMVAQRVYSFVLYWKGVQLHSRYQGYPWLALRVPGIRTESEARMIEPVFCLLFGLLLMAVSEPLGRFIAFGAISFTVSMGIDWLVEKQRLLSMSDGEIEMHYYAGRFRK